MTQALRVAGLCVLSVIIGTAQGCGAGDATNEPAGTVVIDGSSTVFRISKAAQVAFNSVDSEITVVVDQHGTGGGFGRYLDGSIDIVDASRPAKADEESKAKAQGIDWSRFTVGYDGITLVVNPKNDFVKSVTVDQLKTIWSPESKVKTWKDIDPAWPAHKIILYSPDNDSGTFDFFTEAIVGKAKSQRDDVQASSDDNTLVNGVAGDPDALGYFGYAYFAANNDKLRALGVANGPSAQPVIPSPATIADKSYSPLSRPLYIYVKNSAARRPEVGKFVRFYLEKIDELATAGGYDPPTSDDKKNNSETLAKMLSSGEGAARSASPTAE